MTRRCRLIPLLILAMASGLVQSVAALAQTITAASLPAAAQEVLNKGILAAKVPDYLLAIRYFEEARKLAPQAPIVYLNLGLAESKVPSRELRAMAWFGAYLAAYPDAPNAAAVKELIATLEVRSQSNVSRLIRSLQGAAVGNSYLRDVAKLWAEAGNIDAAMKTADLTLTADWKRASQTAIAEAQINGGDIAGAQKTLAAALQTANLIVGDAEAKSMGLSHIAETQIRAGDMAGAQQALTSALEVSDLIESAAYKSHARRTIAGIQAKAGTANMSDTNPQRRPDARSPARSQIGVSDWLNRLDDDDKNSECPLNSGPFVDLAAYLKSLPPSDNSEMAFNGLRRTAENIIKAQNVISGMLKQQARR